MNIFKRIRRKYRYIRSRKYMDNVMLIFEPFKETSIPTMIVAYNNVELAYRLIVTEKKEDTDYATTALQAAYVQSAKYLTTPEAIAFRRLIENIIWVNC